MSIFYPDNDNRQGRVAQLTTDAGDYLQQAKDSYQAFEQTVGQINARIASLYEKIGITAPAESEADILGAANIPMTAVIDKIKIAGPVIDVVGFAAATRFLAPGLLTRLMASGLISEETAASTFVLTWGGEVSVGLLITGVATAIVAGLVVAAVGVAIEVFEGSQLRDELRHGISKMCQIRGDVVLSWMRSKKLADDLASLKTALDALQSVGLLTPAMITNLIHRTVMPSVAAVEAMTMDAARAVLDALDRSRDAWTNEDTIPAPPPALPAQTPVFSIEQGARPPRLLPNMVLCPAVPGVWETPTGDYPLIRKGDLTAWPMSFADHRQAVMLVLFDSGMVVNFWLLSGITTVTKIHVDASSNMICLTGDGGQILHMTWSQIAPAPPTVPLRGDLAQALSVTPAMIDFGLVDRRTLRHLLVENKSDQPLDLTIQVVSALAADWNISRFNMFPPPGTPRLPAPVLLYLHRNITRTVPARSVTDIVAEATWDAVSPAWDVYSPSDFKGGFAIEAEGYEGAVFAQLQGSMDGGHIKHGWTKHVTVADSDVPPFALLS